MSYESEWRARVIQSFINYRKHSKYAQLVREARRRGFKPAPVEMSLAGPLYAGDIYKWKGGCWVRADYDTEACPHVISNRSGK